LHKLVQSILKEKNVFLSKEKNVFLSKEKNNYLVVLLLVWA